MSKITIEMSEESLRQITNALEVYCRIKVGQFGIAFDLACPAEIRPDGAKIRELEPRHPPINSAAPEAWEMKKLFEEYLSVTDNDGYYDWYASFSGPLDPNNESLPTIKGFDRCKYYEINKRTAASVKKAFQKRDYEKVWTILKSKVNYPDGAVASIVFRKFGKDCDPEDPDGMPEWVKVLKPTREK